jgi:3-methyl-2-oxobutanoate hydroxymethyltransferase
MSEDLSRTSRLDALATRSKDAPPLVMLTAYDYPSAQAADAGGVDMVLVGDSAATNVLGYGSTREISIDELLMLTRAARRGVRTALLVGDLPFSTYESSDDLAISTAQRFVDAGCDLVKVEGAAEIVSRVRAIVSSGMSVVGHVGLLPQGAANADELKVRGRLANEAAAIVNDARELEAAGASALVIEAVPSPVADAVAHAVRIPVIGIGAGAGVDGQVLVYHDLLGLGTGHVAKFVRQYAGLREEAVRAIAAYAVDVRARRFPAAAETYAMSDVERAVFLRGVSSEFQSGE